MILKGVFAIKCEQWVSWRKHGIHWFSNSWGGKNTFWQQAPRRTDALMDTRVWEVQCHPPGFIPDNALSGSIKLRFNADLKYNHFNRYKLPHPPFLQTEGLQSLCCFQQFIWPHSWTLLVLFWSLWENTDRNNGSSALWLWEYKLGLLLSRSREIRLETEVGYEQSNLLYKTKQQTQIPPQTAPPARIKCSNTCACGGHFGTNT